MNFFFIVLLYLCKMNFECMKKLFFVEHSRPVCVCNNVAYTINPLYFYLFLTKEETADEERDGGASV